MASHLHLLLIPLMAPGHFIPMIDIAKLLAKRGLNITVFVTPLTAARLAPAIDRAVRSGLSIRLVQIRFPAEEAGLPPGCETVDSLPSYNLIQNFRVAVGLFQQPVEAELRTLNPSPSCIIYDKHMSWIADTCTKFQIPRILFDGMSCFAQFIIHRLYISKIHENYPPMDPFIVPDLPDRIELCQAQLPGMFNPGPYDVTNFRERVRETEKQAYGAVVNSFEELEKRYMNEYRKVKRGKVWCIGPLSLSNNDDMDMLERGNQSSIHTHQCLKWLDERNPGSVIYACLGSISRLSLDRFIELARGLELVGHPFILVVKEGDDIERWIIEDGFEERVKGKGLLIRGWAPQVSILSHVSVGGFLTHCGWNSTLEGICGGVVMITWPIFADQFLNEKLVVEVLGVGVGVGAKRVMHLEEEGKFDDNYDVGRDGVRTAIEKVMDGGKEASERRKRAKEIKEMAKQCVEIGGSSYGNITALIEEIDSVCKNFKDGVVGPCV